MSSPIYEIFNLDNVFSSGKGKATPEAVGTILAHYISCDCTIPHIPWFCKQVLAKMSGFAKNRKEKA